MQTYQSREAAQRAKWAVAKALGVAERELVIGRCGDKFAIRTKEGLESYLSGKK